MRHICFPCFINYDFLQILINLIKQTAPGTHLHTHQSDLPHMLILIAGITGNIGQHTARAGISCKHQIRGLGRSPDKLDAAIHAHLESFILSQNYYDVLALERAVDGVDAVICAYAGVPELILEGQLLLLRAAERVGIKVRIFEFHFMF